MSHNRSQLSFLRKQVNLLGNERSRLNLISKFELFRILNNIKEFQYFDFDGVKAMYDSNVFKVDERVSEVDILVESLLSNWLSQDHYGDMRAIKGDLKRYLFSIM